MDEPVVERVRFWMDSYGRLREEVTIALEQEFEFEEEDNG